MHNYEAVKIKNKAIGFGIAYYVIGSIIPIMLVSFVNYDSDYYIIHTVAQVLGYLSLILIGMSILNFSKINNKHYSTKGLLLCNVVGIAILVFSVRFFSVAVRVSPC